jgi:hypothetical protein
VFFAHGQHKKSSEELTLTGDDIKVTQKIELELVRIPANRE